MIFDNNAKEKITLSADGLKTDAPRYAFDIDINTVRLIKICYAAYCCIMLWYVNMDARMYVKYSAMHICVLVLGCVRMCTLC